MKDLEKIHAKGVDFLRAKNFAAALKIADKLKRLDPNYKMSYYLESAVWNELGNPVKEYDALKKILPLLKFSTREEKIFAGEVLAHLGDVSANLALTKEAAEFYASARKLLVPPTERLLCSALFLENSREDSSLESFRALYTEYKKILVDVKPFPKKFYAHKKIRVGFLSSDLRKHPVINWSWSLLTKLDKNFFATYFYSNNEVDDIVTKHLRASADGWHDIQNLSHEQVAKIIREDEIDILFDLNGLTDRNRLPAAAYRPASVQMSGIGYGNSTGLNCFDYFLSDVYCAGDENYFVEKLIKLPHTHACYEPATKPEPAAEPPCLKNKFVTFGCFNQFHKITDSMLRAWKKILDAVPNSHLLLKNKILNSEDGKIFTGERLKDLGFDLDRVEMRGWTATHPADYNDMDIALDTFPYTGVTTTAEALYMGVPVVSLYGDRHGSRFGLSILKNVGLEDLAVGSYDEYIARAVMLTNDWELLTLFRKNLRGMMKKSPLMDSQLYLREIQDAFRKILEESK